MAIETVRVKIEGISPLLMHAYPMVAIEALDKKPPEEQAELAAYRDPVTKGLYVPGVNLQRSLIAAASFSKGKGRASLQKQVAACVFIHPERIPLANKDYALDARPVVIPATKGRIMRYRPRLDTWTLNVEAEFDPNLLKVTELRRVFDDAGSRVGLLDFRPEHKGPFGRFSVVRWDIVKD